MAKQTRQPERADPKTNHILAMLEQADYDALMLEAKVVPLKFRKRLYDQDDRVDAVYFPLTCMVSLIVTNGGTPRMEMATIGREGVVGASEVLQTQLAMGLNLIQIPGAAVRIKADAFRKIIGSRPLAQNAINRNLYALMRQILYGAACNRIHSMEERCARWLLMTHDRAGGDTFPITQEFLSHMLGVRRATVNVATGMLKKAGFIRYVRGKLTVVDRAGLEAAACNCYQSVIAVYNGMGSANRQRQGRPSVKVAVNLAVYLATVIAPRGLASLTPA
jgi:CRP-like cAMP-binding protein